MKDLIEEWRKKAKQEYSANRTFLKKIKKSKGKEWDTKAREQHEVAFSCIDCLQCANCCTTLGPRINPTDIRRMAKYLKMKESELVETYLQVDDEGDHIMKSMPCPFLGADNYCSIYEARPKACREYPHTDMDKFASKPNLHALNTLTCPAAFHVVSALRQIG